MEKVLLKPMSEPSLADFMSTLKTRYILNRQKSNLLSEAEAIEFTEKQWINILPNGTATADHHFLHIHNESGDTPIGSTWIQIDITNQSAFIFEVIVQSPFRGQGFGRAALEAIQSFAKEQGCNKLGLNVFASNTIAKTLYRSLGFEDVSTDMIKSI